MAKQITTWRPDTCGCEVELEWDDAVPATDRTHTVRRATKLCDAHATLTDPKEHHAVLFEENPRKNKATQHVREVLALADNARVDWNFEADRSLTITLPKGTSDEHRKTIQDRCDAQHGRNKVKVY
jgi:hypothetical protein